MIKTIIADDHPVIRESLLSLLSTVEELKIIGSKPNGQEVIDLMKKNEDIELLILDLSMPIMNGLDCLKMAKELKPDIKSIFLTIYEEEYVIKELMELGADAILLKNASQSDILEAVHTVLKGERYLKYVDQLLSDKDVIPPHSKLTSREKEVLRLIANGLTSKEIAETMSISPETAKTHRRNLLKKLHLDNTAKLVAFANNSGII